MNNKELLNKLPGNWLDLKLKDYIKLSPIINDEEEDMLKDESIFTISYLSDLDKNINMISLLTDTSIEEIEKITMVQLDELINKISFLSITPDTVKTKVNYKEFKKLSYDNFITFQKLQLDFTPDKVLTNAIYNLPTMLSVFSKDNLDEEYFLNLSMPEVIAGFFIVTNNINWYLRHLKASSLLSLMKIQTKQIKNLLMLYWQKVNPFKKTLAKSGTTG